MRGVSRHFMRAVLFAEGADECPLVAIADFEPAEVVSLRGEIARLAAGEASSVVLEGDVQLTLQLGERSIGILQRNVSELSCVLSASAWRQVVDLLEPFMEPDQRGYKWLDETGEVKLLISRTGEW